VGSRAVRGFFVRGDVFRQRNILVATDLVVGIIVGITKLATGPPQFNKKPR
jgi:hypothetical protein